MNMIVTAAPAAPLATALAAPEMIDGADPIFAAIQNHRAANATFEECLILKSRFEEKHGFGIGCNPTMQTVRAELDRLENKAGDAERDAADAMITTVPTTLAGLREMFRYVVERHEAGDEILDGEEWLVLVSTTIAALEKTALKAAAYGIGCIRCGQTLIAPDWSKYVNSLHVHHTWSCESCGVQFETSDHLRCPEPRRTVQPLSSLVA